MAKLTKPRRREELAYTIWDALVRYVNADDNSEDLSQQQKAEFQCLVEDCVAWTRGDREKSIFPDPDGIWACEDIKNDWDISNRAMYYRPAIRRVLRWLSSPVQQVELASGAALFLSAEDAGVSIQREARKDYGGEGPLILDYVECATVGGPICRFILNAIDLHDLAHLELRKAIPIGLCQRSICNSIFLIERAGRRLFCTDACRAKWNGEHTSKEEKAKRMRKYRADQKAREVKRSKARRRKS
jgi:hypothetical protein